MASAANTAPEIVCLVDDDPAVLTGISRLLASDGIGVRSFDQPLDFLRYIEGHYVPLVVLDIWMEHMTGLEVQAKLARISPGTRTIVMTGRKDPAVEQNALDLGATAFFIKPFDDAAFLEAVRRALSMQF